MTAATSFRNMHREDPQAGDDLFPVSLLLEGFADPQEPHVGRNPFLCVVARKGVDRAHAHLEKPVLFEKGRDLLQEVFEVHVLCGLVPR